MTLCAIEKPQGALRSLALSDEVEVDIAYEIRHRGSDRHKHLGGLSPRPVGHQQEALTISGKLNLVKPRVTFENGVEALNVLDRNRLAAANPHPSDQIAEELAQRYRFNSNLLEPR